MDDMDYAQQRIDIELERAIEAQKSRRSVFSEASAWCVECGAEIAPERRQALPGVRTCIGCAEAEESVGRIRRG